MTLEHVRQGAAVAQEELEDRVFAATCSELSRGDMTFLHAMSAEDPVTSRAEVAARLGKGSGYISTYKKRLLEAGLIEEPQPGVFKFALPGFGAYLKKSRSF